MKLKVAGTKIGRVLRFQEFDVLRFSLMKAFHGSFLGGVLRSAVSSGRFNPDSSTRYRLMTPLAFGVDVLATRTCLARESGGRLAAAMMKPRDL